MWSVPLMTAARDVFVLQNDFFQEWLVAEAQEVGAEDWYTEGAGVF